MIHGAIFLSDICSASFPKVDRDIVSMIVVSDEGKERYDIHTELVTKFPTKNGMLEVPQAFTYVIGKSESDDRGILGMQFVELRNYYDLRTMEKAFE